VPIVFKGPRIYRYLLYIYILNTVFHLLVDKPNIYRYNRYDISDINIFKRVHATTLRIGNILVSRFCATLILYIVDLVRKKKRL